MPNQYVLMRGDTLSQGRYRILNQIALPEPQQRQGAAWTAIDMQASRVRVVIREVVVPQAMARVFSVSHVVSAAVQRVRTLERYEGFPQVIDLFSEEGANFMVLLYPEGESLAALLNRQSGALPEPVVAEYGYQLCALLAILADQQPPIVHGSINPETIIIREDIQRASLIPLPLFPPEVLSTGAHKVSSA